MISWPKCSHIALALVCCTFSVAILVAQKKTVYPEDQLRHEDVAAHLRFLASDELMGRMTGTPWIQVAARYLAEQFRASGLHAFPQAKGYFQLVPLLRRTPPTGGHIVFLGDTLMQAKKMVLRNGGPLNWNGRFVFVGYGLVDSAKRIDDYRGLDVRGNIAVARFGAEDNKNLYASFTDIAEKKRKIAAERGAIALIEFYRGAFQWRSIASYFAQPTFESESGGNSSPHLLVEDTLSALVAKAEVQSGGSIELRTEGFREEQVHARNVIGLIKGSDLKLRDEYVLLTAHYDHVGTGKSDGASSDTIFNGARDNGMGTVALLAAARSFAANPPKRSVIVAAVTSEEIGLFGSRHLAANSPVPLEKIVFDLNCDGAGFDDTTIVTVVGLERTTAQSAIKQGAQRYGLRAIPDPVPEQNLFNRSDNVSFASQGIPAPTFSPGFHQFGEEILKYYHKTSDQADDHFNFSYFLKFCKAFVHSARVIGDMKEKPFWKPGDPYEKAGTKLYQK